MEQTQKRRHHRRPDVPKEALEAERVARQMYNSLTQETAPRATSRGYVMGACAVLKGLVDQACQQGEDRDALKRYALDFINGL